jgi:hypothetical protein
LASPPSSAPKTENAAVFPFELTVAAAGVATVGGASKTVTVVVPCFEPLDAVIVTLPARVEGVNKPVDVIVPELAFQVKVGCFTKRLPIWSKPTAVNCCVV